LAATVDLVRPLVLGHMPQHLVRDFALLLAYGVGCYYVALIFTRKRLLK
jgi:lipooligosaccharide transport system permease protein